MVTAAFSDALSNPVRVIRGLQSAHGSSPQSFHNRVNKHFRELFPTAASLQQISPLDVTHPPESYSAGSLVRFRSMIQDTSASPEIYLAHTGYGLDSVAPPSSANGGVFAMHELEAALDSGMGLDRERLRERTVVWGVSVPGESAWVGDWLDGTRHPPAPSGSSVSTLQAHKFPLPATKHVGAYIKTYDNTEFKPTVVHDFIGILTFDPRSDTDESKPFPTLHVLFHSPLPATLIKATYPLPPARGQTKEEVKKDIVEWLAREALGGDTLASEYVLLVSLARVQTRTPPLLPPSLLLSRFPSTLASPQPLLQQALSHILPVSVLLPLSLPFLNDLPFAPSSTLTCDTEELKSGALQLSAGATVLVTEHDVGEGKLGDLGVRNISTMQAAIASQSLAYVFPFSLFEFPVDLGFIICSEGSKSPFFTTDLNLPLRPSPSTTAPPSEITVPSPDELREWRLWLAGAKARAASKMPVSVSAAMGEHIQSEFVRERKEGKGVDGEELGRRMALAKLMALLLHEDEITKEVWEEVRDMEQQRKDRLR